MKYLIFLFFCFIYQNLHAVEIYSFFDKDCQEITGYLIGAEQKKFSILTFNGEYKSLELEDIKGVLVYNFVNPPLKNIKPHKETLQKIKNLSIETDSGMDTFDGFPVQFVEDLIIFLGIDGSIRVHKLDSIHKIRPHEETALNISIKKNNLNLNIKSSGYVYSCPKNGLDGDIRPNRILVDKIKIKQFMMSYADGYGELESFEERTYLYARPMLYKQKTRFGIVNDKLVEQSGSGSPASLPFIEWSSGTPYDVQSLYQIGKIYNEYGADLNPLVGFKAEAKAHFFHAIFIGNLSALSAGDEFFSNTLDKNLVSKNFMDSGMNYSVFFGGDYGKHSASLGLYYPIYAIKVGNEFREALSTSGSYSFRYMHTTKFLRLFTVASVSDKDKDNPTEENLISTNSDNPQPLTRFETNRFFIRGGADLTLPEDTYLGANFLLMNLKYQDQTGKGKLNRFGGTLYARRAFGDYVSFGARITYLIDKLDAKLNSSSAKETNKNFAFGFEGALIF